MDRSEAIRKVVELATAIQDYWDTELPKRYASYPFIEAGEDSGPPPPQNSELSQLLSSLSEEQIHQLILLVHLGRGECRLNDLSQQFAAIEVRFRDRDRAIQYPTEHPILADHLEAGLEKLAQNGLDLDRSLSANLSA